MFQMMGVFAEFERAMIQERIKSGLARVKQHGTKSGKMTSG
jgi:DNA invertase Pin-like site-specific DNA recombinase